MTAFAEAEKAADWVMQRHPIQLAAAAKLASEEQAMEQGLGAHKGVIPTRDAVPQAASSLWVVQPVFGQTGIQMGCN